MQYLLCLFRCGSRKATGNVEANAPKQLPNQQFFKINICTKSQIIKFFEAIEKIEKILILDNLFQNLKDICKLN